ncbi:hypothetical protein M0G74_09970 [Microbulbifer sp. CAU 1566]|uniref:DUF6116 family protein n=1 Tax=Microbulbifer sp. CAU 1566 TaxID=2933269 RepID=UPI00200325EE|nr:DUF6116 family protein [Microbulbifer sp. CAU 1566]MCK7597592.1 hypothetical protein [Microbulbifer sp. CAU 1566]
MKRVLPSALVGWFLNYARRLKHPQLFKWICALFLIDLLIPDLVPFVDEILLGLATLFLAAWKKHAKAVPDSPEDNQTRQEKVVTGHAEKVVDTEKHPGSQAGHGKH